MLDQLTPADFNPRIGEVFRLAPEEGDAVDAVLTEVTEQGAAPGEGQRAPFSVLFTAPAGSTAPQGTFTVDNDGLGSLELFLVPVQHDAAADGVPYEAVFG